MNKGIIFGLLLLAGFMLVGSYFAFFRAVNATTPGVTCKVHDLPLEDGRVPIKYGLILPTNVEIDAQDKLFPHAASAYHGGCVITPVSPNYAWVSFCSKCRKAEANWRENWERKLAPVTAHWERVRAAVSEAPKFHKTSVFIDREVPTVGIEGQVSTDGDFADLQRLVARTAPPHPVLWKIRVGP